MEKEEEEGQQSKCNGEYTKKGRGEGWCKVSKGRSENRKGGEGSGLVIGGEVTTNWAMQMVTTDRGEGQGNRTEKMGAKRVRWGGEATFGQGCA